MRATSGALLLALVLAGTACADDMLTNGSFESGISPWWTNPSYTIAVRSSGWNGVSAADGSRFLAVSGPVNVGYTYVRLAAQSLCAPFGEGTPNDNFLVYLYAYAYLHTTDNRRVSYTVTLKPGYGSTASVFYGAARDEWVLAQTSGYYYSKDPYDPTAPTRTLDVIVELRDSLQAGEFLAVDWAMLFYGGRGILEP